MRFLQCFGLLAWTSLAFAQGGGASAGGGAAAEAGTFTGGKEESFDHILTPGDRTDWPFKAKAGEVLIFRAISTNFDAAIEITDPTNKKLAENDDEAVGKQNARLLFYVEKDGEFRAHVKNYRSSAGGAYRFSIRRFTTVPIELDLPLKSKPADKDTFLRVKLKKGQFVQLQGAGFGRPINPDGGEVGWIPTHLRLLNDFFEVKSDGEHYIPVEWEYRGGKPVVSVRPVLPLAIGAKSEIKLEADDVAVWSVSAKARQALTLRISEGSGQLALPTASDGEDLAKDDPYTILPRAEKDSKSLTAMFLEETTTLLYLKARRNGTFRVSASEAATPWKDLVPISAELPIGERLYYRLEAKAGDLIEFAASATTFDPAFTLYDSEMDRVEEADDTGDAKNPSVQVVFTKTGTYYLVLHCHGDGGGGAFQLRATRASPKRLDFGQKVNGRVTSAIDGIWSLSIGKPTVVLIRSSPGSFPVVLNSKGNSVRVAASIAPDGSFVGVVVLEEAGEFSLWFRYPGKPLDHSVTVTRIE